MLGFRRIFDFCLIFNFQPIFPKKVSGRTRLLSCIRVCHKITRQGTGSGEFKIGIACNLRARWELYKSGGGKWEPEKLFILECVENRVAAGFLEAALIQLLGRALFGMRSIHVKTKDNGGTGARENCKYFVYMAVKT